VYHLTTSAPGRRLQLPTR